MTGITMTRKQYTMRQFALMLAALLAALALTRTAMPSGDVEEYAVMTVALASHGSAAISQADVSRAARLVPVLAQPYAKLAEGMRTGAETPRNGFNRGRDGAYFAIHFFAYPALAAPPFRLLQAAGADPLKAFQVVNVSFVLLLGLCLFRLFGSAARAAVGVLLFLLCGGLLYWNWTSPECMSAASLLSALILFSTGAPRVGGLLAGLAAMQNPPIGLLFGFAPLFHAVLHYRVQDGWRAALRNGLRRPNLLGMLIVLVLAPLPILFSLWQFGVPSLIAKYSTSSSLIGVNRLISFFFDLNQGMIVGVPALLAALLLWRWRGRNAAMLALCTVFAVAMAAPALSAENWNSGASGMMRYAFWSAMPFLFAFLLRLRSETAWPRTMVLSVLVAQFACMAVAKRYSHVEFSPLAKAVLAYAPGLYNPDPEIFHERLARAETPMDRDGATVYLAKGKVTKTMYAPSAPGIGERLCGRGMVLSAANHSVDVDRQFRYINGPLLCTLSDKPGPVIATFGAAQFGTTLQAGWSKPEFGGGNWDGAWSDGKRSTMSIPLQPGQRPHWIALTGHYSDGNRRTRLTINGVDMGWQKLNQAGLIVLPAVAADAPSLQVTLEHEAPGAGTPQDRRQLAFFIEKLSLH